MSPFDPLLGPLSRELGCRGHCGHGQLAHGCIQHCRMIPTLQPRIYIYYLFSLYFHDPTDPPDRPTYLVFFSGSFGARYDRMDGLRVRYDSRCGKGVKSR